MYFNIGLQSLVVELFVCLASNSISAAELWKFLILFNSPEPPVVRQRTITSKQEQLKINP